MVETVMSAPAPVEQQLVLFKDKIFQFHEDLQVQKQKVKRINDMIKDGLTEDDEYRRLAEEVHQATIKMEARKKQLMADPEMIKLNDEAEHAKMESRDLQGTLSSYLESYAHKSGNFYLEDKDGARININRKFSMKKVNTKKAVFNKKTQ